MTAGALKNDGVGPTVADGGGPYAAAPRPTLRNFTYFP